MGLQFRDDVTLVDLEEQGILFCEGQQRLYALDPLAAALWAAMAGGSADDEPARFLTREAGLSLTEAEGYVSRCLRQWDEAGLLRKGEEVSGNPASPVVSRAPAEQSRDDVFGLSGFRFGIDCCDPDVATAVRDVFGHLKVGETTADFVFSLEREGASYRLLGRDNVNHLLADPAAVAVRLKTEILQALLRRSPKTIAIHAAALDSGRGTVLLVGPSGCGKTTIAALLNARGWPSIADDVVLIDSQPQGIRGLPLAYALKPGSWPVIARSNPSMDALPSYVRPDGKTVRYLRPTAICMDGGPTAAAIVFPRFAGGASTTASPISRVDAMVSMLGEARNASEYLTTESFLAVATIVSQAAVYELRFGCADEAVSMLLQHEEQSSRAGRSMSPATIFRAP